jgi:hypothetical protein
MAGGRPRGGSKLVAMPGNERDRLDGQWTREHLERMDADFVAQVERAIASGQEHVRTSTVAER